MIEEELKYLKALELISGFGPFRISSLLEDFSKPSNVFLAKEEQLLSLKYIPKRIIKQFIKKRDDVLHQARKKMYKDIKTAQRISASFISILDSDYPKHLREVKNVSPPILYYKGNLEVIRERAISIIGTRNPSSWAKELAYRLGYLFAKKGWGIISGMASGIDREAHLGVLKAKGNTVAVLGGGVDKIYPKENADIYLEIAKHGCIVSEYSFGSRPEPSNLKKRNRVIVALSKGIIAVEAPIDSGAFNAIRFALENRRPIFTPRPTVLDHVSEGNIKLIACREAYELPKNNLYEFINDKIKNWSINKEKFLPITKDKNYIVSFSQEDKILWFLTELKKAQSIKNILKEKRESDYDKWFNEFQSYVASSQDAQNKEFFEDFLRKFHNKRFFLKSKQKLSDLLHKFINQRIEKIAVQKFINDNFKQL